MKVVIITVGSEIVSGRIVDTNSAWLSGELVKLGFDVVRHSSLPDDYPILVSEIRKAIESDLLAIVTGGIGPTDDDLTRQAVSEALSQPLVMDENDLTRLKTFYKNRGWEFPNGSERQCSRPEGSALISNNHGTASCFLARKGSGAVAVLPGIPAELKPIWTEELAPALADLAGEKRVTREIRLMGAIEPEVNNRVSHLLNIDEIDGAILVSDLEITLRWSCVESKQTELQPIIDEARTLLGNLVFSDGQPLAQTLISEFTASGKTIATAESCTGGLIADMLTDISGSSAVLKAGFVTYTEAAKHDLGVPKDVISEHGVVSKQVALSMAECAATEARSDYAVAVTGVAGPSGGSEETPIGTIWLGIVGNGVHQAVKLHIPGKRRMVKIRTAKTALYYLHHLRKYGKLPKGFFLEHREKSDG
ncbi:MAG: CinA family nicotinamide mononucleotide deamidase-related protein [Planctomycetes bacterium]|nr:CinA family nicotinamide mononucleotide deamidase-related protein [Planctomycetota bacterium]